MGAPEESSAFATAISSSSVKPSAGAGSIAEPPPEINAMTRSSAPSEVNQVFDLSRGDQTTLIWQRVGRPSKHSPWSASFSPEPSPRHNDTLKWARPVGPAAPYTSGRPPSPTPINNGPADRRAWQVSSRYPQRDQLAADSAEKEFCEKLLVLHYRISLMMPLRLAI